ncbi:hypothetical protein [Photobacterium leiognathi]|uniref:hypothetical protein n=1 Tax=Photobacterium leiognathi TaxID=553611 RepID=UPI003DA14E3D
MKKSEIVDDLKKIHDYLAILSSEKCLINKKDEILTINNAIEDICSHLNSSCLTFSITARAGAQVKSHKKCNFCGK